MGASHRSAQPAANLHSPRSSDRGPYWNSRRAGSRLRSPDLGCRTGPGCRSGRARLRKTRLGMSCLRGSPCANREGTRASVCESDLRGDWWSKRKRRLSHHSHCTQPIHPPLAAPHSPVAVIAARPALLAPAAKERGERFSGRADSNTQGNREKWVKTEQAAPIPQPSPHQPSPPPNHLPGRPLALPGRRLGLAGKLFEKLGVLLPDSLPP